MRRVIPGLALSVALFGAVCHDGYAIFDKMLKKTTKTDTADDAGDDRMPEYKGIKHTIGVTDFANRAGFQSQWELGTNLGAMLESALYETGRFVIVERGDLGSVMAEQDLQASGRAAEGAKVAQTGELLSARYLATGDITEASESTSGEGAGINIRGFRIGGSTAKASIVVVVKLVDTTTGEVVASKRVRGEAGRTSVRISGYKDGLGGSLGAFAKTPLGEAAQDCINQAVKFIAESMEDYAVEGAVVLVKGDQIVINLGSDRGVTEGAVFLVRDEGEVLRDPDTGEVLDRFEGETTATLEVTRVREKVSYCKLVDGELPERGDRVESQSL